MSTYIGIDLGGTTIKGGLFSHGEIVKKETIAVDHGSTTEGVFEDICRLISSLKNNHVEGIGFAAPAIIDFAKGMIYGLSNLPQLNGFNLIARLEERFKLKIRLQNDANCFVLGEKYFGAAKGAANVVGLITGTGVGAGIVLNNTLYNGINYGAGELGMIPYEDSCFELYCGGQYFIRHYNTSGELLGRQASKGDPVAVEAFHAYGRHLGNLINLICYFVDPEMIVIGGSVSQSFELYKPGLEESMSRFYFDHTIKTRVVPSTTSDVALFGAVGLFVQSEKNIPGL